MTEFEQEIIKGQLLDRLVALSDAVGTHLSIYLTVISAYLVMAYFIGNKLTRLQVSIATGIYMTAYSFEALVLIAYNRSLMQVSETVRSLDSSLFLGTAGSPIIAAVGLLTLIAGFVAPLWFMWSIRHPKENNT